MKTLECKIAEDIQNLENEIDKIQKDIKALEKKVEFLKGLIDCNEASLH